MRLVWSRTAHAKGSINPSMALDRHLSGNKHPFLAVSGHCPDQFDFFWSNLTS
jgi:hypothetical protein